LGNSLTTPQPDAAMLIGLLRDAVAEANGLASGRAAGEPTGLRQAGAQCRRMGRALLASAGRLDPSVNGVVPAAWLDDASRAFVRIWHELRSEMEERAGSYQQMGAHLEDAADQSERLNSEIQRISHDLSGLLNLAESLTLQALALTMLAELQRRAMALQHDLESTKGNVRQLDQQLAGGLRQDLHFRARTGVVPQVSFQPTVLPSGRIGLWGLQGLKLNPPGLSPSAQGAISIGGAPSRGDGTKGLGAALLALLALAGLLHMAPGSGTSSPPSSGNQDDGGPIVQARAAARNLPGSGDRVFVPPKGKTPDGSWSNQERGFVDENGHVWRRDNSHVGTTGAGHWDVDNRDGTHDRVTDDGRVIGSGKH
jgi:hypothetical protein